MGRERGVGGGCIGLLNRFPVNLIKSMSYEKIKKVERNKHKY